MGIVLKQQYCHLQDYDEQGDYIRTWVPELAKVPAPSLFEPWRLSRGDQEKYGVQIGVSSHPHQHMASAEI